MNRWEAYLAARQAEEPDAPPQEPPKYERYFDGIGMRQRVLLSEIRSDAVRFAESKAEDLDDMLQNSIRVGVQSSSGYTGHHEVTWNTPFGPVYCRRSKNPEAKHGWIFVDG